MTRDQKRRAAIIAAAGAAGLAGLAVAGLLFAWSGLYSVAASRGHWAIFEWFLAFAMRNSVRTHALLVQVPPLDNPHLARLGAGHFHSGCAFCHGAPGIPVNPVAEQMLPPPPTLSEAVGDWATRELFWIVKHGIKYTGMPAWAAQEREDEVWAVVAFLRRLPQLTPQQYRELALDRVEVHDRSGPELATAESDPQAAGACARCHGAGATGPASHLVPVLHGQKVEYLIQALQAYAKGSRRSGIMQPLASPLDDDSIARLARYYAGLARPPPRFPPDREHAHPASVASGRRLAAAGDPDARIPACNACHGDAGLATFPRLDGQHAPYLARQLQLWKEGVNTGTGAGTIMAPIAGRLTDKQVRDVSAYYASLAPAPVPTPAGKVAP
jgi:cytochrome c553